MEVIFGKCGSGKTKYFKELHKEYEEKTIEDEDELAGILNYSNSDFRENKINLLVNVWFDFDQRKFKGLIDFNKYPLVTLECHKKCIVFPPLSIHGIGLLGNVQNMPTNRQLFKLIGYKTTYWNTEDNIEQIFYIVGTNL